MSVPVYKDLDKSVSDLINDDFDSKYSIKIKSTGPYGVVITTNTTFDEKEKKLGAKLAAKYAHTSGFVIDKLEVSADGKVSTETSLTGAAPGLKLEFKGNDSNKGDLSWVYSATPTSSFTGEFDALNFKKASTSLTVSQGAVVGGASVDAAFDKNGLESTKVGVGLSYSVPKFLFAGLKASNNFSNYSGFFSYLVSKELTLIGQVAHATAGKTVGTSGVFGGVYQYCPNLTLKLKATSTGVINASVKKQLQPKFTVVGSLEVPSSSLSGSKFGVNATLG